MKTNHTTYHISESYHIIIKSNHIQIIIVIVLLKNWVANWINENLRRGIAVFFRPWFGCLVQPQKLGAAMGKKVAAWLSAEGHGSAEGKRSTAPLASSRNTRGCRNFILYLATSSVSSVIIRRAFTCLMVAWHHTRRPTRNLPGLVKPCGHDCPKKWGILALINSPSSLKSGKHERQTANASLNFLLRKIAINSRMWIWKNVAMLHANYFSDM